MKYILNKLLDNITYVEKPDDSDFTKCLRQEAARWACFLGIPECRSNATSKMIWHLKNKEHE